MSQAQPSPAAARRDRGPGHGRALTPRSTRRAAREAAALRLPGSPPPAPAGPAAPAPGPLSPTPHTRTDCAVPAAGPEPCEVGLKYEVLRGLC